MTHRSLWAYSWVLHSILWETRLEHLDFCNKKLIKNETNPHRLLSWNIGYFGNFCGKVDWLEKSLDQPYFWSALYFMKCHCIDDYLCSAVPEGVSFKNLLLRQTECGSLTSFKGAAVQSQRSQPPFWMPATHLNDDPLLTLPQDSANTKTATLWMWEVTGLFTHFFLLYQVTQESDLRSARFNTRNGRGLNVPGIPPFHTLKMGVIGVPYQLLVFIWKSIWSGASLSLIWNGNVVCLGED